jgi:hypothetical protein
MPSAFSRKLLKDIPNGGDFSGIKINPSQVNNNMMIKGNQTLIMPRTMLSVVRGNSFKIRSENNSPW